MNENNDLKTAPIPQLLLKYSLPAIIGTMVTGLYNLVDRIFIGNLPDVGQIAMTGLGVTLPVVTIINAFGLLLAVGGATTISLKQGEGNHQVGEKILGNVLTLAVLLGLIITILGTIFSTDILKAFGGSEESIPFAQAYLDVILLGTVFALSSSALNYLIRADGNPKLSGNIMIFGCVVNIFLDLLFLYVFHWGIQGAAIATVVSQGSSTAIGLNYYLSGKSKAKLHKENFKLRGEYCKMIFMIGSAPFAMQSASGFVQVMANNMLYLYGGDLAIGAMATIMSIMMMSGMPLVGLTTGMQPIISFNYGAKEFRRVEATLKLGGTIATGFLLVAWTCLRQFPEEIVTLFNDDPALLAVTLDGMQKYFLVFPLLGITYVGSNFIQSTGKAKLALLLGLLRQVIFLVPLYFFLPRYFGLDGLWYAQPIADVLSSTANTSAVLWTIFSYRKEEKLAQAALSEQSNET